MELFICIAGIAEGRIAALETSSKYSCTHVLMYSCTTMYYAYTPLFRPLPPCAVSLFDQDREQAPRAAAMSGNKPSTETTVAPTGKSALKDKHSPAIAPNKPRHHPNNKRAMNECTTSDALNAGMIRKANTSNTPATFTAIVITMANEAKNRNSHRKPGERERASSVENDKV